MKKYTYNTFIAFTLIAFLNITNESFAFTGEGMVGCIGDCATCHNLSKEEAAKYLKTEQYNATVTGIEMSPVKGLWQVNITQNGKPVKVYIDFAKEFLIQANFAPLASIGEPQKLQIIDTSKIPLEDAIVIGNKNAKNKVIVFDDPDCPYCAKLHNEIKEIVKKRDDIVFYIKMFPLPSHKDAYRKSQSIVCDGSIELLEKAFNKEKVPDPKCETTVVDQTVALGTSLGIGATPSIILPDGRLLSGYVEGEILINIMETPQEEKTPKAPKK